MKKITLLFFTISIAATSFAKVWRVNNDPGVPTDFTSISSAINSTSVLAGDTVHIEPGISSSNYSNFSLNKRLVFISVGYFLDASNTTFPYNSGLQVATNSAMITGASIIINSTGAGSKFIGCYFAGGVQINASASALNITFEKCFFQSLGVFSVSSGGNTNSDGIIIRKCFFYSTSSTAIQTNSGTVTNLTVENCIFNNSGTNLSGLTGSNNIIRNNSWTGGGQSNSISNCYVANNIFGNTGGNVFTNCTIKNNLFATAQTLPGTATGNQINVNMTNVYVGGTTGSLDSRAALKAGSPAIGAGVTISGYTPDCGAFGATDPYKLSGIPAIPSIYSLTLPTSIPTGTATMNVTFSSRNNN